MRIRLLLLLMIATSAGCREQPVESEVSDEMRRFSELAEVEATHVKGLRDEIARIKAEQGTPRQMMARVAALSPEQDLNAQLLAICPDEDRLTWILARVEPSLLRDPATVSPNQLAAKVAVAQDYETERKRIAAVTGRPHARLWVDFEMGFAADLRPIDVLRLGFRLEWIRALNLVQNGRLHEAVSGPVASLFQYALLLDQVWHLAHRLTAVGFRMEALEMVSRIVNHPQCTPELAELARNQLLYALRRLPAEKEAWIGDRAIGLHAFEMVREGYFLSLLSEEESNRLKDAGNRYGTARMAIQNVDFDQLFYLRHMRAVINDSKKPYYQRGDTVVQLHRMANESHEEGEYPLLSLEVLLDDADSVQLRFARDRARLEAWTIALSCATGQQLPSSKQNPQTGEPYQIVEEEGRIVVQGLDVRGTDVDPSVPDFRTTISAHETIIR